jgi:hypothetical protein
MLLALAKTPAAAAELIRKKERFTGQRFGAWIAHYATYITNNEDQFKKNGRQKYAARGVIHPVIKDPSVEGSAFMSALPYRMPFRVGSALLRDRPRVAWWSAGGCGHVSWYDR